MIENIHAGHADAKFWQMLAAEREVFIEPGVVVPVAEPFDDARPGIPVPPGLGLCKAGGVEDCRRCSLVGNAATDAIGAEQGLASIGCIETSP